MPNVFKHLISMVSLSVLGVAGGANACTPAHKITTVVPGTLTVATAVLPPFVIISDGGMSGVDGDIVKKIAEMECLKVDVKQMDFAAVVPFVNAGKADLTSANWYATAERAKVLGVSSPLYLDQAGIFSKEGYTKFSDLMGKTIGTVQGYNWVPDLQTVFGDKVRLYPSPVAMAQDLAAGRVDVGVDSRGAGIYAQQKGAYVGYKILVADPDPRIKSSVEPAQISMLWAKQNAAFGEAINKDIATLHKNSEIVKILKSYGQDPKGANVGAQRLL